MKIIVKEPGERPIRIFLPNFLLRGPVVRRILLHVVSRESEVSQDSQTEESLPCTPEQLGALYDAFSQCLKKFKGLKLVEVESADGSTVLIEL